MSIKPQILAAISGALAAYIPRRKRPPPAGRGRRAAGLNLWGLAAPARPCNWMLMQRRSLR